MARKMEQDNPGRALFSGFLRVERGFVVVFRGLPGGQPAVGGGLAGCAGDSVAGVGWQLMGAEAAGKRSGSVCEGSALSY